MWKFKSFIGRELVGIEGRTIDIGNLKVHIQGRVAEGGFSSVYLARDVNHPTQHYALKHIICNDDESLELVMKEIWVMKSLKGHPNVVTLHAHTILDGGRIKEALLLMEFSEKSLVNVLDDRGAGYFDEKQVLLIFRDVCNAVYAMHSQSPPIAHRDLKAENILKGADGLWKLCDFGSISTNHQRFERPEEMGIEEDNIRKHTTPAYRSPEMWDLFRREIVSEKVDIWALGCLLFRICYFKSAFDGESKLQILNGNYHIPELPKYSSSVTNLIRSMLQASPDTRPDITQVLFWVNQQLPREMQKPLPNLPADMHVPTAETHDGGTSNAASKSYSVPRRNPPPPQSSKGHVRNPSLSFTTSIEVGGGGGGPLGAFWSTQHAKTANVAEARGQTVFDGESTDQKISNSARQNMDNHHRREKMSLPKEKNSRMAHGSSFRKVDSGPSKDIERNLFPEDAGHSSRSTQASQPEKKVTTQSEAVNTFVADFDSNKHSSSNNNKSTKEEALQAEVHKLKEQLNRANLEKTDITNKYEKLCAICRSQRQEIQGLNQAISAQTTPDRVDSKNQNPSGSSQSANQSQSQKEKIEGTIWELEQGFFTTPSPAAKSWQAFPEEPKPQPSFDANILSSQTINGRQNKWVTVSSGPTNWGFNTDTFTAAPASSQISRTATLGNNSQRFGNSRNIDPKQASQPAGWAGF